MSDIQIVESHGRIYKIYGGTFYDVETPDVMVKDLEHIRNSGQRVRFDTGDVITGRSWGEEWDIEGTIGRSMGPVKIPLLIKKSNSSGGGCLLTGCLVALCGTGLQGQTIYRHPFYKPSHRWDKAKIVHENVYPGSQWACVVDLTADTEKKAERRTNTADHEHDIVARFKTQKAADLFLKKKRAYEPYLPINERPLRSNWMKLATETLAPWGWARVDDPSGFHSFGKAWHERRTFTPEEALIDELNTVATVSGLRNRLYVHYNSSENWFEIWQRCPQNTWPARPWNGRIAKPMSREDVVKTLSTVLASFVQSHEAWRQIRDNPAIRDHEPKGFVYQIPQGMDQGALDQALRFTSRNLDTPAMVSLPNGGFYGWVYRSAMDEWEQLMHRPDGSRDTDYAMRVLNRSLALEFPLPFVRT